MAQKPKRENFVSQPRTEEPRKKRFFDWDISQIHHVYSFGIIPFRVNMDNFRIEYLLIHGRASNKWSFPKGKIDKNEAINGVTTAKREFSEETGIDYLNDESLAYYCDIDNPFIIEYNYCRDYYCNGGVSDINRTLMTDDLNKRAIVNKYIGLFLTQFKYNVSKLSLNSLEINQTSEIRDAKWMVFDNAINSFRKMDVSRNILTIINDLLIKQLKLKFANNTNNTNNGNNNQFEPILKIECCYNDRFYDCRKSYDTLIDKLIAKLKSDDGKHNNKKLHYKSIDAKNGNDTKYEHSYHGMRKYGKYDGNYYNEYNDYCYYPYKYKQQDYHYGSKNSKDNYGSTSYHTACNKTNQNGYQNTKSHKQSKYRWKKKSEQ